MDVNRDEMRRVSEGVFRVNKRERCLIICTSKEPDDFLVLRVV